MVALLSSAFTFAQVTVGTLKADVNPEKAAKAVAVKKAISAEVELAANQRLMGYYVSDDLAANGIGIPKLGKQDGVRAVITLDSDMLAPFVGKKVVGIRYGMMVNDVVTSVIVGELNSTGWGQPVTTEPVESSEQGWNIQMLSNPYTIKANQDIYAGFTYNQTATKSGSAYTTDGYPLSLVSGIGLSPEPLYLYANVPASSGGNGLGWYNFGNTMGNLSIQLIIEGDYQGQYLMPLEMSDFQTAVGHERDIDVVFENVGAQPLTSFSYTYTQNGVTSEEKTKTLDFEESDAVLTVPVAIEGASVAGKYPVTLNITKVNGAENSATLSTVEANNEVKAKNFQPTVVMEEYTGTGCGFCPRGMVGMEHFAKALGDQFIGIAIHQYNAGDPMYTINYANLGFTGAPNCKLNRVTAAIDPFYGSGSDIVDDATPLLKNIPDGAVTSIDAQWSTEAQDSVFIQAEFESQDTKTYQVAYVLTADDVQGQGTAWAQSNYFSKAYNRFTYAELDDDLKFLWNQPAAWYTSYPDVLIGSSYIRTTNKGDNVTVPADGTAHGQYNVGLPLATSNVMPGVDKTKINAIVLLIDPTTRTIVNAAKTSDIKAWTAGINTVDNGTAKDAKEVARYTVGGQQISAPVKGINIVKMSDGTTRKVFVGE